MKTEATLEKNEVNNERREILERLESWLETPMIMLGFGVANRRVALGN